MTISSEEAVTATTMTKIAVSRATMFQRLHKKSSLLFISFMPIILLLSSAVLLGPLTSTKTAWATGTTAGGAAARQENQTEEGTVGNNGTPGDEGLAENAQARKALEPSSNQSQSGTTMEENSSSPTSSTQHVVQEPKAPMNSSGIAVLPLSNQSELTAVPSAGNTTANTNNATAASNSSATRSNGKIAFVRGDFEDSYLNEIYVMNPDGSGQTRLTNNDVRDEDPSWSPDGKKIAFRHRDNPDDGFSTEIYVMNPDGSGQTRLTNNSANDEDPSWSPDGKKIAFTSYFRNVDIGNDGIYVMNAADGSGVTRLTAGGEDPSWSPDGKKIAFTSFRDAKGGSNNAIYVMNAADGSGVTRLTGTDAYYSSPSWSPDGKKIAFSSNRDNPEFSDYDQIYVMNAADGSGVTRLTNGSAYNISPDWGGTAASSPTGGRHPTGAPPSPAQAINGTISTIQNLDSIPQSLKTNIISLLGQALDSLNTATVSTSTNNNTSNVP